MHYIGIIQVADGTKLQDLANSSLVGCKVLSVSLGEYIQLCTVHAQYLWMKDVFKREHDVSELKFSQRDLLCGVI